MKIREVIAKYSTASAVIAAIDHALARSAMQLSNDKEVSEIKDRYEKLTPRARMTGVALSMMAPRRSSASARLRRCDRSVEATTRTSSPSLAMTSIFSC